MKLPQRKFWIQPKLRPPPPGSAPCRVGRVHPLRHTAQAPREGVQFENMAPGQRLVLCEETVRERSGLGPHRDLGTCGTDTWGSGFPAGGLPGLVVVRTPLRRRRSWPVEGVGWGGGGRGCGPWEPVGRARFGRAAVPRLS